MSHVAQKNVCLCVYFRPSTQFARRRPSTRSETHVFFSSRNESRSISSTKIRVKT